MRPRAVFFDFDGVLADSVDVKTRAFCALYAPFGAAVVASVREYHLAHGGISRYEKFRHWQRTLVHGPDDDATIDALAERFATEVKRQVIAAAEIPGAGAALSALHGKMPLFVVSGTPEVELRDIVAERGMAHFFVAVRGAPSKKAAILRELAARADIGLNDGLMIGDAMTDHDAAQEVGMPFLGVASDGVGPFPAGAAVLRDLAGLPSLLGMAEHAP